MSGAKSLLRVIVARPPVGWHKSAPDVLGHQPEWRNRGLRVMKARVSGCAAIVTVVMVGSALLAGCGASAVGHQPAPGSAGPAWHAGAGMPRCGRSAPLGSGVAVAAWRLGAVHFLSATTGVALTAPRIPCEIPAGRGQGKEVGFQAQPVRLAVTEDGGRHWVTQMGVIPAIGQSPVIEQVVAASVRQLWAVSNRGKLLATTDGGATWAVQRLPARVVELADAGGSLWALACPRVTGLACRPVLERMVPPAGQWRRVPLPRLLSGLDPKLALPSPRRAVLLAPAHAKSPAVLAITRDGGGHWAVRPAPRGPGGLCESYVGITTAGPGRWWLLCTGGAAAGRSTKALMRTSDAGRTWTVVAAATSLNAPARPGSLPYENAVSIAAGSPRRLWITTPNGLAESSNAGVTWASVPGVRPQGTFATLDVWSAAAAWMLAPGTGLWHTTDGTTWRPLGRVITH